MAGGDGFAAKPEEADGRCCSGAAAVQEPDVKQQTKGVLKGRAIGSPTKDSKDAGTSADARESGILDAKDARGEAERSADGQAQQRQQEANAFEARLAAELAAIRSDSFGLDPDRPVQGRNPRNWLVSKPNPPRRFRSTQSKGGREVPPLLNRRVGAAVVVR